MTTMPDWMWPFLGSAGLGLALASAWLVAHALPGTVDAPEGAAVPAGAAAAAVADPVEALRPAVAGAAGALARPVPAAQDRPGPSVSAAWRWALALGLPLAVVALYAALGHPRALDPAQRLRPADPATMVDRLAARLAAGPGSAQDWAMLGRSYRVLGRHAEAAAAYERAAPLAAGDADLLSDWIESRMLTDGRRFDARSLALLDQASRLAPQHPGVLMLEGLAALQRGDLKAAQQHLGALRAQQPEGSPDRLALDNALAELAAGRDPRRTAPAR